MAGVENTKDEYLQKMQEENEDLIEELNFKDECLEKKSCCCYAGYSCEEMRPQQ